MSCIHVNHDLMTGNKCCKIVTKFKYWEQKLN